MMRNVLNLVPKDLHLRNSLWLTLIALFLILSNYPGKADAAATVALSCPKASFRIELKMSAPLKQSPQTNAKTLKTAAKGQKLGVVKRTGNWYLVCFSNQLTYLYINHAKELFSAKENMILSKFKKRSTVKQIVTVTNNTRKDTKVSVQAFEFRYGEWRYALRPMKGVIGYNGFSVHKREGDGKTPIGIFSFGTAFGRDTKPNGMSWKYKKTTKYDYWIDDVSSKDYNKWITYTGNPSKRWKSYERMTHELYKYGAVINYNTKPIVKGKGSAVFLHIWRGSSSKTAGCVAVEQGNLVSTLKWLNPEMNPHILLSSADYLVNIK
jgi:L,D-peptidoglycan transpeptidase YkuD (ErfK/YbiS/YcfS/YnhG family)